MLGTEKREETNFDLITVPTAGQRWTRMTYMSELTYMDCWNFVAPLIPVADDLTMEIYVMVFNALKKAEEQGKGEQQK